MTTLISPYDDVPAESKRRVQSGIDELVYEDLFLRRLPLRGVQDKVIATFLAWFYREAARHMPPTFELSNETIAHHILTCLTTYVTPHPQTPQSLHSSEPVQTP